MKATLFHVCVFCIQFITQNGDWICKHRTGFAFTWCQYQSWVKCGLVQGLRIKNYILNIVQMDTNGKYLAFVASNPNIICSLFSLIILAFAYATRSREISLKSNMWCDIFSFYWSTHLERTLFWKHQLNQISGSKVVRNWRILNQ